MVGTANELIVGKVAVNAQIEFYLKGAVMPYQWVAPEMEGVEMTISAKPSENFGGAPDTKLIVTGLVPGVYEFEVDMTSPVNGEIVQSQPFVMNVQP